MTTEQLADMTPAEKCCGDVKDRLRAELEAAKAARDNVLWNLAGCGTIAENGPQAISEEESRPALLAVNKLAKEHERVLTELEAAKSRLRLFNAPCADVADLYEEEEELMTDEQKAIRNAAFEEAAVKIHESNACVGTCPSIRACKDWYAAYVRELKKEGE
jgi:hypothetical protein